MVKTTTAQVLSIIQQDLLVEITASSAGARGTSLASTHALPIAGGTGPRTARAPTTGFGAFSPGSILEYLVRGAGDFVPCPRAK